MVQAAIEITKHGAAEERPDLREAYENLAARSMTEDEWENDYEEFGVQGPPARQRCGTPRQAPPEDRASPRAPGTAPPIPTAETAVQLAVFGFCPRDHGGCARVSRPCIFKAPQSSSPAARGGSAAT